MPDERYERTNQDQRHPAQGEAPDAGSGQAEETSRRPPRGAHQARTGRYGDAKEDPGEQTPGFTPQGRSST